MFLLDRKGDVNGALKAVQVVHAIVWELQVEKAISESAIRDDISGQPAFCELVVTEGGESGNRKALGHTKGLLDTVNNNLHEDDEQ